MAFVSVSGSDKLTISPASPSETTISWVIHYLYEKTLIFVWEKPNPTCRVLFVIIISK